MRPNIDNIKTKVPTAPGAVRCRSQEQTHEMFDERITCFGLCVYNVYGSEFGKLRHGERERDKKNSWDYVGGCKIVGWQLPS